jgi:hypothetical protein
MGMKESGVVYFEALSQYLPGWDEEKHKTSVRRAGFRRESCNWDLPKHEVRTLIHCTYMFSYFQRSHERLLWNKVVLYSQVHLCIRIIDCAC